MERSRALEWKVGIFVFIGIAILSVIIFSIGDIYLFVRPGYTINVIFGFVGGLEVASPVRLSGVSVGEVKDVRVFYDESVQASKVKVLVWLRQDAKVRKDARFYISTLGYLGEKYIEIVSAGSEDVGFLGPGDSVIGWDPIPPEKLTMMTQTLTAQLNKSLEALAKVIGDPETKAALKETLKNSADFTRDLKELVADLKAHPWKLFQAPKAKRAEAGEAEVRTPMRERKRRRPWP